MEFVATKPRIVFEQAIRSSMIPKKLTVLTPTMVSEGARETKKLV